MASKQEVNPTPQSGRTEPRELPILMQTLPQELFDHIYDLTFTAVPGMRFVGDEPRCGDKSDCEKITHVWDSVELFSQKFNDRIRLTAEDSSSGIGKHGLFIKPDSAVLLHVDHQSRQKFAASFFGDPGVVFAFEDPRCMGLLVRDLDPAHADLIRDLRDLGMDRRMMIFSFCGRAVSVHIRLESDKREESAKCNLGKPTVFSSVHAGIE